MKISIIGTGYVGLVTGTCFAETGNHVSCVDIDQKKVDRLSAGELTIYEPGLEKLFQRNLRDNRLSFTTSLKEGVEGAEIIFLALPTPPGEDGSADLSYVLNSAAELGRLLNTYTIIVNKSTVPVGTSKKVREAIAHQTGLEFDIVSNPEFLREGVAVEDFMKPDRVIIGTGSERARKVMNDLYAPFVRQGNPVLFMDEESAELTKYAANSFLAMKISFMNEIANLCEKFGADVDMVRRGVGSDNRIGKRFLFPGIGYGGSCFPKDVQALASFSREQQYDFRIIQAVMEVNARQKGILVDKIRHYFQGSLKGKILAFWGLAFKPNTDDIREAPALQMMEQLLQEGAEVRAFDPEAMTNARKVFGDRVRFSVNQYQCLENADALIIATEWNEFRTPDFTRMSLLLRNKVIFDGRNLFELGAMKENGFKYFSVGRKSVL